jgi:hypothetical protein
MIRPELHEILLERAAALDTDLISANDEYNALCRAARDAPEGLLNEQVGGLLREAAAHVRSAIHAADYTDTGIRRLGSRVLAVHPEVDETVRERFFTEVNEIASECRNHTCSFALA